MTNEEFCILGKTCRDTKDNLVIGAFAAELIGESYPFSTEMSAIVFKNMTDEEIGRKYVAWIDSND